MNVCVGMYVHTLSLFHLSARTSELRTHCRIDILPCYQFCVISWHVQLLIHLRTN